MGEFNNITWKFSNAQPVEEKPREFIQPEEGRRDLHILNATYDDSKSEYEIFFEDLGNGAKFSIRHWLFSASDDGSKVENGYHRNMLMSLGEALAGKFISIPAPEAIKGGVIRADIYLKESAKGSKFPRVRAYLPACETMVAGFSDIDQYCIPDEEVTEE